MTTKIILNTLPRGFLRNALDAGEAYPIINVALAGQLLQQKALAARHDQRHGMVRNYPGLHCPVESLDGHRPLRYYSALSRAAGKRDKGATTRGRGNFS